MAPLPYTDSGAGIAFYLILGTFVVLEQRVRLRSWRNQRGTRADHSSLLVLIGCISAGIGGAFALVADVHSAAISAARWPIFILGLLLMCVGIAIRQWAVALLGEFFTVDVRVHRDQTVIERGPYRWARHPSYTGLIITL